MYKRIMSLEDRVAVVTGGSGLLGKEFCSGLADFGANVIIADINEEESLKVVKKINHNAGGNKADYLYLDINSEESINEFTREVLKKYGTIDVLVNNAYPRNSRYGTIFEDVEFDSFQENIISHMGGYFLVSQKISKLMMKQKSGVIVNLGSIYGVLGPNFSIYGNTGMTMPVEYSMIKGGIINFTKYLSTYLAPYNIRVNSISPGGIFDNQPQDFVEKYCDKIPLGRMAEPSDMVGALIFLASDASKYITGQNIMVDGGLSVW